jgi:ankyrin repeat protein
LHAAALEDKDQFVRLLLEHGADLNQTDASGEIPADLAGKNRCYKTVIAINEVLGKSD